MIDVLEAMRTSGSSLDPILVLMEEVLYTVDAVWGKPNDGVTPIKIKTNNSEAVMILKIYARFSFNIVI